LHEMSLTGGFRQDLYYRLNVMSITMPPLRERAGDAMLLARHFATQTAKRYGLAAPAFSAAAIHMITDYTWPGNVRELRHQVSRAMLLSHQGHMTDIDLALPIHHNGIDSQFADQISVTLNAQTTLDDAEKAILLKVLAESDNNVSRAARKLGVTRMTMRYRMDKHQIIVKSAD
jgi:two-component system response regulator AtoC